ncbi:hypothetical protein KR018_012312 [Drosophila ironensis]|nr:hypothetical protein KR018_012312 [Drosophila ironensis]
MKSEALHKFLAVCSLLIAGAWGHSLNPAPHTKTQLQTQTQTQTAPQPQPVQRPVVFIENNIGPEDVKNYQITRPRDPKPGEPCLTISWKTNPDGSGPDFPNIYIGNGYFGIMTPQRSQTKFA